MHTHCKSCGKLFPALSGEMPAIIRTELEAVDTCSHCLEVSMYLAEVESLRRALARSRESEKRWRKLAHETTAKLAALNQSRAH